MAQSWPIHLKGLDSSENYLKLYTLFLECVNFHKDQRNISCYKKTAFSITGHQNKAIKMRVWDSKKNLVRRYFFSESMALRKILELDALFISKQNTKYRTFARAKICLAITLRYLTGGCSQDAASLSFRVVKSTVQI